MMMGAEEICQMRQQLMLNLKRTIQQTASLISITELQCYFKSTSMPTEIAQINFI